MRAAGGNGIGLSRNGADGHLPVRPHGGAVRRQPVAADDPVALQLGVVEHAVRVGKGHRRIGGTAFVPGAEEADLVPLAGGGSRNGPVRRNLNRMRIVGREGRFPDPLPRRVGEELHGPGPGAGRAAANRHHRPVLCGFADLHPGNRAVRRAHRPDGGIRNIAAGKIVKADLSAPLVGNQHVLFLPLACLPVIAEILREAQAVLLNVGGEIHAGIVQRQRGAAANHQIVPHPPDGKIAFALKCQPAFGPGGFAKQNQVARGLVLAQIVVGPDLQLSAEILQRAVELAGDFLFHRPGRGGAHQQVGPVRRQFPGAAPASAPGSVPGSGRGRRVVPLPSRGLAKPAAAQHREHTENQQNGDE